MKVTTSYHCPKGMYTMHPNEEGEIDLSDVINLLTTLLFAIYLLRFRLQFTYFAFVCEVFVIWTSIPPFG